MSRKFKNTFLISSIVTFIGFTGCADGAHIRDSAGFNLSQLETIVKVNETTYEDLRKFFRQPTLVGTTVNDEKIVAYTFRGADYLYSTMEGLTISLLSMGTVSATFPDTVKIAYFRLDKDNKVVEIKKNGYAYLLKERGSSKEWNKCEVILTDAEVNSDVYFTGRLDLCERYRNEVAQRKGIDPKDVDDDEEFFPCDATCHAKRGAIKLFGQFKNFKTDLKWKQGDGSRANETSILHNPIKKVNAQEN